MSKSPRIASFAAHLEAKRIRTAERHRSQARAANALALLEIRREIRDLDRVVYEYEEIVARLPEDLPIKPGRHRVEIGAFKLDLLISGKKELSSFLATLKERRSRLVGVEARERRELARELESELLRYVEASEAEAENAAVADDSAPEDPEPPPVTNGASRADKWW